MEDRVPVADADHQQEVAAQACSAPGPAVPRTPTAIPQPVPGGPQAGSTVKMSRLRQVIAQRMSDSLEVSAQLTTVQRVDMTEVGQLRAGVKAEFASRHGAKLTYLPFYAKATIEALQAFPQLNASIDAEAKEVTYHGEVNLAIAVDSPKGLLVPVVRNVQGLDIVTLAQRFADVAERARVGRIGADELRGGTFTITNVGSVGSLFGTPIINQPQVAILSIGAIFEDPAVVRDPDGKRTIAIRSLCYLSLTYDHRLVDGADAGRFLSGIRARLEESAFENELDV